MVGEGQGVAWRDHQRVEKQESNEEAGIKRAEAKCQTVVSTGFARKREV